MAWVRAMLRGQQVYAKATESGDLAPVGGRVEVRYKPNDGRRYQAAVGNLLVSDPTPLPESTCGEAEAPPPREADAASAAKGGASSNGGAVKGASRKHAPLAKTTGDGAVIAYTDGACTGNPGPAGLGVVIVTERGQRELSEYLGQGTNNIAELTAILRAIELTEGEVIVHTDSQYAIGVLGRGWKAKANTELIAKIKATMKGRNIDLVYVPGHAGVPLNERCDELGREAIVARTTRRNW